MKLIEYSSEKYGRIPTYIETGRFEEDPYDEPLPPTETVVKPPSTQEVSDFVFVFVLSIIVFLMLWK